MMKFFLAAMSACGVILGTAVGETSEAPRSDAAPTGDEVSLWEIESSNFDADLSPGESTTNAPAELDEIYAPQDGYLESLGVRSPLRYLIDPLDDLYEKTGLRLGVAHTMLFLQPMGGQSSRYGAGGDLDLISAWTLIGRGTENTGRLVFTGEYRYTIGAQPPSLVRGQVGAIVAPTGTFNDRGWVVRDAYWVQRLFEGKLRFLIGRGDPSDYVGSHWLQNVNNSFINRSFSANPSVPWPGHGPLAGVSVRPTDWFYATVGAANAYGDTELVEIQSLFEQWDIFTFGEIGWTPTFNTLGEGRYAFSAWHMPERSIGNLPSDYGFSLIADQNLTPHLQTFARYAYADGALTNLRHSAQLGFGFNGIPGRSNDLTGLALSLNIPVRTTSWNETVMELFHRFQVTANNQLSVGFQVIANPGNAIENEPAGMFYMRLRSSF